MDLQTFALWIRVVFMWMHEHVFINVASLLIVTTCAQVSMLRVRSKTLIGSEAALSRYTEPEEQLVNRLKDFVDGNRGIVDSYSTRESSWLNGIHWMEKVKQWLMLLLVRFPRALRQWEIWLMLGGSGLFYLLRGGRRSMGKQQQQQQTINKQLQQQVMGKQLQQRTVHKNSKLQGLLDAPITEEEEEEEEHINSARANVKELPKISDDLQKQFEKAILQSQSTQTSSVNDDLLN